jgi:cytochrome oxidase Cu insertion factor (SCO1/SenC/PrrC family)|tara:strand:+ start:1004 stop:1237 length:234 start_codon:yes stop_codon:yes gene_type:complete
MKKLRANIKMYILFFITIVISLLLLLSFSSSSNNELEIGIKAPDFQLFNQDEKLISLSDYQGKNVIIYFFPKAFTPG